MSAAFRSGAVMGFLLAGFGLLNLFLGIILFQLVRWGLMAWCGPGWGSAMQGAAGLLVRAQVPGWCCGLYLWAHAVISLPLETVNSQSMWHHSTLHMSLMSPHNGRPGFLLVAIYPSSLYCHTFALCWCPGLW